MATKTILDFEKPIFELEQKVQEMRALTNAIDIQPEIEFLEKRIYELKIQVYQQLTRWQKVQIARHPERPQTSDFINNIFDSFTELHGDRYYGDDHAIIGGIGKLDGKSLMIVGHQKGRDTKSNIFRNFGMANPEGYRKANRLFHIAEKFNHPIICFIDTPGAFPGIEAEERGQAEAIAKNLFQMSSITVPIIVIIIGEGASGGAIGIGVGNKILMLENAWYSVISPESCSSILWRSWDFKEQAAEALQLSAQDLKNQGLIDEIVPEPVGGAHNNHSEMFINTKNVLINSIDEFNSFSKNDLIKQRREKFYKMGVWNE